MRSNRDWLPGTARRRRRLSIHLVLANPLGVPDNLTAAVTPFKKNNNQEKKKKKKLRKVPMEARITTVL